MSDQPSPPPKPKPGSLKDRIAAFEKSASAAAPAPAPAPRPKPAGFSSWKPKAPSPPSSPSAASTDAQSSASTAKAGGMSASDAKESITKAGSLKDRMAALQGKGAFGAPPPVAPKPAVEKPKWKPPPVVHAPAEEGDDAGESSTSAIAAAVERTISPPVSVRSHDSIDNVKSVIEGEEPVTATEGDNENEQSPADPEEEERQRRAAIAARMARLGGARVGMAPPVFGKKPVRKPTQEETQPEEIKSSEEANARDVANTLSGEVPLSPPTGDVVSPPSEALIPPQLDDGKSAEKEYLPKRKDSENLSILSSETSESNSSRTPTSMPIPSVPRRAGPPRKKPVKAPTLPPSELTEEKVQELVTPLAEASISEKISTEVPQEAEKPTLVEEAVRIIEKEDPEILKDSSPEESAPEELRKDVGESQDEDPTLLAYHLESPEISSSSAAEEESGLRSPPPSTVDTTALDVEEDDDQQEFDAEMAVSPPVPVLHTAPHALHADVATPKIEQTLPKTSSAPDALDEEEEEARKKRVADRMAKMGGINPFAPPPALISQPAEGSRSPPPPPPSTALSSSSPTQALAPVVDSEPQTLHSSSDSPPLGLAPGAQKEDPVETKVEEESSDEEDENDDVLDNTAHEQYEDSKAANLSHTETQREFVSVTSSPPVPLASRPAVQVQQFEHEEGEDEDEESDYDDEENEEVSTPARPGSSKPPGHPSPEQSPPVARVGKAPSPPSRPAQPPRRVIPQAPEQVHQEEEEEEEEMTDEEADERLATSQLFVPPPSGRGPISVQPRHQYAQDEEDASGSENDTPALPVPHRKSLEVPPPASAEKAAAEDEDEADSDHDGQALPIPPMRDTSSVPRVISPPIKVGRSHEPLHHPPPISRGLPTTPQAQNYLDHSPGHLTPSISGGSEEILDEEEGDPIDPSFHSPSRQTSFVNLRSTAQVQDEIAAQAAIPTPQSPPTIQSAPPAQSPPLPPAAHPADQEPEEDEEQMRRKTIAERMAKLGGIRFGGAPIPTPTSRPKPRQEEEEANATGSAPEEQPSDALSEEEEEKARKERISAKLANMGGMRIGMMPMGMGGLPPQKSHILREENMDRSPPAPPPAPKVRAVPPSRPPPASAPSQSPQDQPQSHDTDSDYGTSEDGVKVEAEESEAETGYEHVEEAPPPVPSRDGRSLQHRQSTGPPTSPPPRPPIPTAMPVRRSSTLQSAKSEGGISLSDVGTSPPQKKSSFMPQSEYVMVEEPEIQETPPPPPPARRTSRAPPARSTPQIPQTSPIVAQTSDLADSISSQWELPSIPTSSLDFGAGPQDLSLSWTDAAEPSSPIATSQPSQSPPSTVKMAPSMSERQLSADALMAMWGRVGVQVCEVATSLFEKSKKTLIGDGSYAGFINEVLSAVPNAAPPSSSGEYGYVIYVQSGPAVQKRINEIMPGDIVEIHDAKLKGHKGIQTYHQNVGGSGETLLGVVGEFEAKKSKIRVFQANQHVGQQTVESVSYRLEDLKSGTVKVYRVLDA